MTPFAKKVSLSAGSIVLSFAVFWILLYFLGASISNLSARVAVDRANASSRAKVLDNLSDLKNDAAAAAVYQQKFALLLPAQDALLSYPQFLEDMGRIRNVEVNFNFAGAPTGVQGGHAGYIPFDMGVSGQPSDIRDFLGDLELRASKFMTNIDSIDMSAAGSGRYNAATHGRVFFE